MTQINWTMGGVENLNGTGFAIEIKDDCSTVSALFPECDQSEINELAREMTSDYASTYDFNGETDEVMCSVTIYDGRGDTWNQINGWQFACVPFEAQVPGQHGFARR